MIACHMSNERVIFTDKSSVICVDLTFLGMYAVVVLEAVQGQRLPLNHHLS